MNTFTALFLAALAVSLLVQFWLAGRHTAHVKSNREQVPQAFSYSIPLDDHRKAADYTVTNTRLGKIELLYGSLLLLAWTLGGGLEWMDQAWRAAGFSPLVTGVAFMLSTTLIMSLLDLPFSVYLVMAPSFPNSKVRDSFSAKKSKIRNPMLCRVFSYFGPIFPKPTMRNFFIGSVSVRNLFGFRLKSFLNQENIKFVYSPVKIKKTV